MEPSNQKKSLVGLSKLSNSHSVRKATKFIAPVLLSLVLLQHSSYLLPLALDFCTMVVDKNYMFILCNGILVLIAKTSGLIGSGEVPEKGGEAATAESRPELIAKTSGLIGNGGNVPEKGGEAVPAESRPERAEKEEEAKKYVILITEELKKEGAKEEEEEEEGEAITEAEKEEEAEKDGILVTEEVKVGQKNGGDEEVEDEGNGLLSAEELQRKCEEFIKKMKAGIKFEAQQQQQLIMVQ